VTPERLPPASQLIKELTHVPEFNQPKLDQTIKRTDAARHGRGVGGQLTETDIQLLDGLDDHPALSVVFSEHLNEHRAKAHLANRYEVARVIAYLKLLDDDEVQRTN
jgi:hypothetical protein